MWQPEKAPRVHDHKRSEMYFAWLEEETGGEAARLKGHLEEKKGARALFSGMAGNSLHLFRLMKRWPGLTADVLENSADAVYEAELEAFEKTRENCDSLEALMPALRRARYRIWLVAAMADLGGAWSLPRITDCLSEAADRIIRAAFAAAVTARVKRGHLDITGGPPDEIADACGGFVLALGKLGGAELNYSSDVDLMVLYDRTAVKPAARRDASEIFIRITRDMCRALSETTVDGFAFRTDLRLRPDPGATPLAIATQAAESYYQSIGQTWERAALIKARAVAGDARAAKSFLDDLSPFIWRRNLDFAAIQDIHAMKARLHDHHRHKAGKPRLPGYDVKLGRGGIREIEFIAQIEQLISGGREWQLRARATIHALDAAAGLGRISRETIDRLNAAYIFLRTLEHRLQMLNDEQVHELPESDEGLDHIARFMGFEDRTALQKEFKTHTSAVQEAYARELSEFDQLESGPPSGEALEARFQELGFPEPASGREIIERWRAGRYRALRSDRSRKLLDAFLDDLLRAFSNTSNPGETLARFDNFLSKLPAGVQIFSLFQANHWLFKLIARIMGTSPFLAEQLARRPNLLDAVLDPGFYEALPDGGSMIEALEHRLAYARSQEDILDRVRRVAADARFQVGVHLLESIASPEEASTALAAIADTSINAIADTVEREFENQHGTFPGGELAIIAMGSYGARELTYTSDLDLILLYRAKGDQPDGKKALSAPQYYSRLGTRFITAVTALTGEGRLYEIDMRLRPSGRQGPLVVTLKTFSDYQAASAWTWEHMALTRARVVRGSKPFAKDIKSAIRDIVGRERDRTALATQVHDMRLKTDRHFGTGNPWQVKSVRGGLADAEYIVQFLMLLTAKGEALPATPSFAGMCRVLAQNSALTKEQAARLQKTHSLYLSILHLLRLSHVEQPEAGMFSGELKTALTRATGEENFERLSARLDEALEFVYQLYCTEIEAYVRTDTEEGQDNGT